MALPLMQSVFALIHKKTLFSFQQDCNGTSHDVEHRLYRAAVYFQSTVLCYIHERNFIYGHICLKVHNIKCTPHIQFYQKISHGTWKVQSEIHLRFVTHGDKVTGEWRKLHKEKLRDLYSLPNIVQVVKSRMRRAGHVGEGRGVHRVLVGKPEGKRPLGRPRCRWEDNIKMDLPVEPLFL